MKYPIQEIFLKHYQIFIKKYNENYYHTTVINSVINCKTKELGGHSTVCKSCGDIQNHYNSCRNRHCPNCQSITQAKWIDTRNADVLNASYFHTVFTIPKELNNLTILNQELMYKLLFDASAETLKTLAKDSKHLGADIGFISILHTSGSNLSYHPHIHVILLGGGLTRDLKFKHSHDENYLFPARVIANLFRKLYLNKLTKIYNKQKITFNNKTKYLKDSYSFEKFINFLKKKNWNINIKETLKGAENVIKYLGKYTHRVAISNSRIISITDTTVTFRYKNYKTKEIKEMTLHPIEFIRRFTMHILPKGFIRMRHYGILSNRNKKTKIKICRNILKGIYPKSELDGLKTEEIILKLFNIDVSKCKSCGIKNLKVMSSLIQLE